jgi:hypothetical protein
MKRSRSLEFITTVWLAGQALLVLVMFTGLLLVIEPPVVYAQNILIFSTSHDNKGPSKLDEASGVLKIEVSAFTKILELRVNDEVKTPDNDTRAVFEVSYSLQPGENAFVVYVKTEAAEETKEFVLNLMEKEAMRSEGDKKPYRIITILSAQSNSNVTNAAEDTSSDTKLGLTLIPSFSLALSEKSRLDIQAILLREKFSNSDFENYELVYNQIKAGWLNESGFGDWRLDVGWSDAGLKTDGSAYEFDVETGTFIGAKVNLAALDDKNVSLLTKYTLRNQAEAASEDYDGDGGLLFVGARWDKKFGQISSYVKGGYEMNDAKGKYKDFSASSLGLSGTYPLSKAANLGALLKYKASTYAESDPLKGDKEASALTTLSVNASYKFNVLGGILLLADATQKQKSTNIEGSEYSAMLITLSGIYVF